MARMRTYTDEELAGAVVASSSWRGLLRHLGLTATSSGAMRSVRSHADRLGLDYSHFVLQRRWTEDRLRAAISSAATWPEVYDRLGLQSRSAITSVRGHTARLGIATDHLSARPAVPPGFSSPCTSRLPRAGPLLAAAWYTLCGDDVSWPLEPCRYDLVVSTQGRLRRVQVKTTTTRAGSTWKAYLSTSRRGRTSYGPDELDDFFVIDGDLRYYVIPLVVVGGLHAIHLRAYEQYQVQSLDPRENEYSSQALLSNRTGVAQRVSGEIGEPG